MTAKEFLQNKYPQMRDYLWNSNPNIDDEWVAKMMEEYAKQVNGDSTSQDQALNLADVGGMLPEEKNRIDLAYLTGVFNVAGIDVLSKEIARLKEIGKNPHEIFS